MNIIVHAEGTVCVQCNSIAQDPEDHCDAGEVNMTKTKTNCTLEENQVCYAVTEYSSDSEYIILSIC